MTALFGTMEVDVAVIEWESDRSPDVVVAPAGSQILADARAAVVEGMAATVESYDPDGCRAFVLGESELDDRAWLDELCALTTVPYVTIVTRTIPIQ